MNRMKAVRITLGAALAALGPGLYATSSLADNISTYCWGALNKQPACVLYPWANGSSSVNGNGASASSIITGNTSYYVNLGGDGGHCKPTYSAATVLPLWTDGNFNYYSVGCTEGADNTADGASAGPWSCNAGQNAFRLDVECTYAL